MNLVIVESPTKARTLEKFLDAENIIMASGGHIRDLPDTRLGINIENNFKPSYFIDRNKLELVTQLREIAAESDNVYLATDHDREGEAIAWHLIQAEKSASVTHNHPEGIKGAQAVASAIFLAKTDNNKSAIWEYIESTFKYDLSQTLEDIRPGYSFDETCQGSVPQSIIAFLESDNYEDAIRKSISLGGDSDTMACITGGIAEHIINKFRITSSRTQ
jgi:5S rRNA maturation endonuclease (ribonuclease M5)